MARGTRPCSWIPGICAEPRSVTGLHPLAPYLTQLITVETAARLGSLPHLALLLGTAEALLLNPGIDMEPYVHQLLPAVLTCLVARRLGVRRPLVWAVRSACVVDPDAWPLHLDEALVNASVQAHVCATMTT